LPWTAIIIAQARGARAFFRSVSRSSSSRPRCGSRLPWPSPIRQPRIRYLARRCRKPRQGRRVLVRVAGRPHSVRQPSARTLRALSAPVRLVLAGLDVLGLRSAPEQQAALAIISTVGVLVMVLVGRRLGGSSVALVAGSIAAIHPLLAPTRRD